MLKCFSTPAQGEDRDFPPPGVFCVFSLADKLEGGDMERRFLLRKAVARYGLKEYPLHGFPEVLGGRKEVASKLRSMFPSDTRAGAIQITDHPGTPGYTRPAVAFHFPDWAVEVRYEQA